MIVIRIQNELTQFPVDRCYDNSEYTPIYDRVYDTLDAINKHHGDELSREDIHNLSAEAASWSELSEYEEEYTNLEKYGITIRCFDPEFENNNSKPIQRNIDYVR